MRHAKQTNTMHRTVGPPSYQTFRDLFNDESIKANGILFNLATKHFNERRIDVLPALSALEGCNSTINSIAFCDSYCTSRYELLKFFEVSAVKKIHAVVGMVCTQSGRVMNGAVDALLNIPQISTAIRSGPFSNKVFVPQFSRTIPSETSAIKATALLLRELKVKHVAVVYSNSDQGLFFKDDLLVELTALGIKSATFGIGGLFGVWKEEELQQGLSDLENSVYNIVIVGISLTGLKPISDAISKRKQLLGKNKLYVVPGIDRSYVSAWANDANVTNFMSGALLVDILPDISNLVRFGGLWGSGNFTSDIPFINAHMPPFGKKDNLDSCLNSPFDNSINASFFNATVTRLAIQWGYTYDAVMALGFATCALEKRSIPPSNGTELWNEIRKVDFEGLSGRVRFTPAGDRDEDYLSFRLTNWYVDKGNGGAFLRKNVGFLGLNGKWNLTDFKDAVFRSGTNKLPATFEMLSKKQRKNKMCLLWGPRN